jgi:hypothetical protein
VCWDVVERMGELHRMDVQVRFCRPAGGQRKGEFRQLSAGDVVAQRAFPRCALQAWELPTDVSPQLVAPSEPFAASWVRCSRALLDVPGELLVQWAQRLRYLWWPQVWHAE